MVYTSNSHFVAMKKKCNTPFSQIVAEHGCKECSNSSYLAPCYCTQNPNSGKVRFLWKLNTVLFKECNPTCNKLHKLSTKEGCAFAPATKEGCAFAPATKEEGCALASATKEGCALAPATKEEGCALAPATKEGCALAPATKEESCALAPATKEGCALAPATKEGCALALSTKEEGCALALSTKKGCVAQGMQPYVQQTFPLELFQPQKAVL